MKPCRLRTLCFNFTVLTFCLYLISCAIRPYNKLKTESETVVLESPLARYEVEEYRLGYGDVIEVKFFNNTQFNETVIVRPDGRISMEKVGDIQVAGMTPSQLSEVITQTYAKIIKNPEVTVIVRSFGGYQVYVLGEVNSPGAFPVQRNMTILQALAQAGGHKETAQLKSILLMRRNPDGAVVAKRVDLSGPSPEAIKKNDLYVEAFDIVYVPKTFIANINTFLTQALAGVIQPLDIYLRAAWWYHWK